MWELLHDNIGILVIVILLVGILSARMLLNIVGFSAKEYTTGLFGDAEIDSATFAKDYIVSRNSEAQQLGMTDGGFFIANPRMQFGQTCVQFWINDTRDAFIAIFAFRMLRLPPIKRTEIITQLENGRILVTQDQGNKDYLYDAKEIVVRPKATLADLILHHERRLPSQPSRAKPFSKQSVLTGYEAMEMQRALKLEQLGFIHFLDPARTTYRYTGKGVRERNTRIRKEAVEEQGRQCVRSSGKRRGT